MPTIRHSFALIASLATFSTLTLGKDRESTEQDPGSEAINFHEHIAPLVHQSCMECHREGEAAPFPLVSFKDVSKRAKTIQAVIEDRYMPPWHPVPGHGDFSYSRRLSEEEIDRFGAWIEAGKPEGDSSKAPPLPHFPKGWQAGEPDIVLKMEKAFPVPADGPDIYRNFVLPLDLPEDKWVKAIELRPQARSVVHHVLFFLDGTKAARDLDGKDGKPGFNGMGFRKSGSLGAYVPGSTVRPLPEDLARSLPKGSDLILAAHFHPSGKAEWEQMTVGIHLADKEPSRKLYEIQVPPGFGRGAGIDIAPGTTDYTIEDSFKLPVDAEAISVGGHAHYICEEMKMTATLPGGEVIPLLYIDDWDLDWQDRYFFKEPVFLPAGTVIHSKLVYDNSAANPDNPFDPPQRIKWGRQSTDEMGSITLMAVPASAEEANRLTQATRLNQAKALAELGREVRDGRLLDRLPQVLRSLDKNGDGKLQSAEMPPRFRDALFNRLDADDNKELDKAEIQSLADFLKTLKRSDPKTAEN